MSPTLPPAPQVFPAPPPAPTTAGWRGWRWLPSAAGNTAGRTSPSKHPVHLRFQQEIHYIFLPDAAPVDAQQRVGRQYQFFIVVRNPL